MHYGIHHRQKRSTMHFSPAGSSQRPVNKRPPLWLTAAGTPQDDVLLQGGIRLYWRSEPKALLLLAVSMWLNLTAWSYMYFDIPGGLGLFLTVYVLFFGLAKDQAFLRWQASPIRTAWTYEGIWPAADVAARLGRKSSTQRGASVTEVDLEAGSVQVCRTCNAPGELKYCQKCKSVLYCCPQCQKQDWPRHKKECSELRMQRKSELKKQRNTLH